MAAELVVVVVVVVVAVLPARLEAQAGI